MIKLSALVMPAALLAVVTPPTHGQTVRPERTAGIVAVALSARDSVALFDARTLQRITTLAVGPNPHEISAAPSGYRAYVANAGGTSISVLDVERSPSVVATWPLPDSIGVHDVAASADGATIWGAAARKKLLIEIDARSGVVRRRWPLARDGGWMVEMGSGESVVIVANLEGGAVTLLNPRSGQSTILDAHDGEIEARQTRDGREIWSVNFKNDSLSVFDARTGRLLQRFHAGAHPGRVAFTPDGRTALTVNGGDSLVVAFDVATKARRASVTVPGGPKVIAVSADGLRAYVSHPERQALTMIDVASMTVVRSVSVPGTPDGVALLEPPRR